MSIASISFILLAVLIGLAVIGGLVAGIIFLILMLTRK